MKNQTTIRLSAAAAARQVCCNTPKNVGLLVKNCQASRVSVILSATSVLISSLSSLLWKESQTEERSWRKGSS